jgi:hypothetical protein
VLVNPPSIGIAPDSSWSAPSTREFPQDTNLNSYFLPMVRASIELNRHDYDKAVESLRAAQRYELGLPPLGVAPLAVLYLRGYALLGAHQNKEAAAEFQRILDHPGIVVNSPIASLAHLGLGRVACGGSRGNKGPNGVSGFSSALERRRPRHSHPEASQDRVREAAVKNLPWRPVLGSNCALPPRYVAIFAVASAFGSANLELRRCTRAGI